MVVVVVVTVLALTLVAATGHLRPLSALRVRAVRLLVASAVLQVGTASLAPGSAMPRVAALVATILLVGLFLGANLGVPGMPLVAAGLLLNVVVIVANGAMPVSAAAETRAGVDANAVHVRDDPLREPLDNGTRLPLLADRVPVPAPGWAQVVSVGDVLAAAGIGLLLIAGSVPPPPQRHQRTRRRCPAGQLSRADRSIALAMESTTRGSYS
ncbi:MAG: DUF5317 domain-containing protein [Sporichthyaceae bacterium]